MNNNSERKKTQCQCVQHSGRTEAAAPTTRNTSVCLAHFRSALQPSFVVYQWPLELPYGVTVHKAPGRTLNRAVFFNDERSKKPPHEHIGPTAALPTTRILQEREWKRRAPLSHGTPPIQRIGTPFPNHRNSHDFREIRDSNQTSDTTILKRGHTFSFPSCSFPSPTSL